MKDYGFKTKCRALFVNTVCISFNYELPLDTNFFLLLQGFAEELMEIDFNKYIDYLDLVIFFRYDNGKFIPFESEWSVANLFSILDTIHTYSDLKPLYDDIGQDNVDKITELSELFIKYINYINEIPTLPNKH